MNRSIKASLVFVFLVVSRDQQSWTTMKPLGSGFYVEMPGAPKDTHGFTQTREGPTAYHGWGMTTNHVSFIVAYCDLPEQVTKRSDVMLDFGKELLIARFSSTKLK